VQSISEGRRVLRRYRYQVGALMLTVSLASAGLWHWFARYFSIHGFDCEQTWQNYVLLGCWAVSSSLQFVSLSFAPLEDDLLLMRSALIAEICLMALSLYFLLPVFQRLPPVSGIVVEIGIATQRLGFIAFAIRAICSKDTSRTHWRMCRAIHWANMLGFLKHGLAATALSLQCHELHPISVSIVLDLLPILICNQRQGINALLNRVFIRCGAKRAAAGIACLVGRCSTSGVLAQAQDRFRTVTLSRLTFEDLAPSTPSSTLFSLSSPTPLGQCDAFVSHSWSDDPLAKWSALQRWRIEFVATHGKEPAIWLDRCCIDQSSIDADVQCLPVFLSGCRSLVVLCGTSYLSRLWCIIELLTFVHMGGSLKNIVFLPVLRDGMRKEDRSSIDAAFQYFDAKDAMCSLFIDRQRLLSGVRIAFGHVSVFSGAAQQIFKEVGWTETPRASASVEV